MRAARARESVEEETEPAALDAASFRFFAEIAYARARIVLRPEKRDMVRARLARRLRALGLDTIAAYRARIEAGDAEEIEHLVNALTTNLTSFFREPHHFDHLVTSALPEALKRTNQARARVRIWSAGCSSGQEAYSIALSVAAQFPSLTRGDFRVLATDIDTEMVATGAAGRYPADQARDIPDDLRKRFIEPDGPNCLQVARSIRDLVRFKPLNLMDPWPMRGPFDAVFCRNVVIYFDKQTQVTLFDRIADMLAPEGYLYIGHSESLFRVTERFAPLGRTIYRRVR